MKSSQPGALRAAMRCLALLLACPAITFGQDRMPMLEPGSMTPEQRAAVDELRRVRGIELRGPWIPLLRSPEVLGRARAMGDYLRFDSALPPRLSEFVILLTAREWRQQYEWQAHSPIAVEAGVSEESVAAIAQGRRPTAMGAEETVLYDLVTELQRNRSVSDTTYARALELFGERGIIDTVSIVGYYTLLAMVMNTARTGLAPGTEPVLPSLP